MKSLKAFDLALSNTSVTEEGEVYNIKANRRIKSYVKRVKELEYLMVSVYDKNKKYARSFYVHRLVAFMYCDGYEKNKVVEHLDGNRMNNTALNLRWVTAGQRRELRIETVDTVTETTHLANGMTILPTEEWYRIKNYITLLTDQIRYNNV
jgi:hypothetical protein